MVKLTGVAGVYALIIATPVIAIVYLTYRTYLQNIDGMSLAAKAEAEAEAKAEAAAQQAEQAANTSRNCRTTSPSRSASASSTRR